MGRSMSVMSALRRSVMVTETPCVAGATMATVRASACWCGRLMQGCSAVKTFGGMAALYARLGPRVRRVQEVCAVVSSERLELFWSVFVCGRPQTVQRTPLVGGALTMTSVRLPT